MSYIPPIIPWVVSNFPKPLQDELSRRQTAKSFNHVDNQSGWDDNGEWKKYQSGITSWVKMTSNGRGSENLGKHRFVLTGNSGNGFYESYGFKPSNEGNIQTIGYTPEGIPHTIVNDLNSSNYPINTALPGITSVSTIVMKELYRRSTVEFLCFNFKQLEYLTAYFLVPGISILLEWGWNLFNPNSLVATAGENGKNNLRKIWNNSYPLYTDNILLSKGNYDVIFGIVSNFNWSMEGNKIICSTEITSKDRIYAGLAADSAMTIKSKDDKSDEPDGILTSIKQFVNDNNSVANLKIFAKEPDIKSALSNEKNKTVIQYEKKIAEEQKSNVSGSASSKEKIVYSDNVSALMELSENLMNDYKEEYLRGVFWGRDSNELSIPIPKADFDSVGSDSNNNFLWLNMGLIVELLNYFSYRPGVDDKAMFRVSVDDSVICGHPNLMSCDPNVLIPNYQAPKFHYGDLGRLRIEQASAANKAGEFINNADVFIKLFQAQKEQNSPSPTYIKQEKNLIMEKSEPNKVIKKLFYQSDGGCYRSDLDLPINKYRYKYVTLTDSALSYSFPSKEDNFITIGGNIVEKDYSGLLSNIYFSYAKFKEIVMDSKTYIDIYNKMLDVINNSTDNFWDLGLIDGEGKSVIADRNYISKANFNNGDKVFSFDYYDSNSIIKSFKFRPQLSDAVATRTMYGETNNSGSNSFSDKYDLLNYQFKDDVILRDEDRNKENKKDKEKRAKEQIKEIVKSVQVVDMVGDPALQMTIYQNVKDNLGNVIKTDNSQILKSYGLVSPSPVITNKDIQENPGSTVKEINGRYYLIKSKELEKFTDQFEIIKLIMPDRQLLRMMLHDKDEANNPIYCAIQPGITAELTIQGLGGLRTFQYFLVKNLPQPYSHENIIFRIVDVHQTIESGDWNTTIKAGILPLKKYIKDRLHLT